MKVEISNDLLKRIEPIISGKVNKKRASRDNMPKDLKKLTCFFRIHYGTQVSIELNTWY